MHLVLCLFYSYMHNLEVLKKKLHLFGKLNNYIDWKAVSSLRNIQIFKYTPDCNCRSVLWSTDRSCNVPCTMALWILNTFHQWSKQITKSVKNQTLLGIILLLYFSQSFRKYLYDNQNNWYPCSTHSEIMTWVSFYYRLMKNGILWRQQHSIIWMWIPSLLTYLLPNKCALLVKAG